MLYGSRPVIILTKYRAKGLIFTILPISLVPLAGVRGGNNFQVFASGFIPNLILNLSLNLTLSLILCLGIRIEAPD